MKRDVQIRIEGDAEVGDGRTTILVKNYPTVEAAQKAWPKVIRQFRKTYNDADDVFEAELVEVVTQESFEGYRHLGCPCALCGKTIRNEEDGDSSENGSIHIQCGEDHE